ncbi:MAG: hypothetical protein WA584_14680 [Pyrinomonadaceae bacterium]
MVYHLKPLPFNIKPSDWDKKAKVLKLKPIYFIYNSYLVPFNPKKNQKFSQKSNRASVFFLPTTNCLEDRKINLRKIRGDKRNGRQKNKTNESGGITGRP